MNCCASLEEGQRRFAFKAKGSGKSGLISVSRCGQEVLERTACQIQPENGNILLRMEIGFPANGRTINARELEKILFDFVPECVKASLFYKNLDAKRLRRIVDLAEDQEYIRKELPKRGLVCFRGKRKCTAKGIRNFIQADA